MKIISAEFFISSPDIKKCPKSEKPEFAFIGRSNVGKSSLINMIAGNKNLAKTSQTPGKTRLINLFDINNTWLIADLPGYGYARLSKDDRYKLENIIQGYIVKRDNLACLFVLIDSRLEPQRIDIEFITWLGQNNIPFVIVYTKIDKITSNVLRSNSSKLFKVLLKKWEELPKVIYTSSSSKKGKDDLLQYIEEIITEFYSNKQQ